MEFLSGRANRQKVLILSTVLWCFPACRSPERTLHQSTLCKHHPHLIAMTVLPDKRFLGCVLMGRALTQAVGQANDFEQSLARVQLRVQHHRVVDLAHGALSCRLHGFHHPGGVLQQPKKNATGGERKTPPCERTKRQVEQTCQSNPSQPRTPSHQGIVAHASSHGQQLI